MFVTSSQDCSSVTIFMHSSTVSLTAVLSTSVRMACEEYNSIKQMKSSHFIHFLVVVVLIIGILYHNHLSYFELAMCAVVQHLETASGFV